jgi:L-aminopeptidase/D-esterase-like protein
VSSFKIGHYTDLNRGTGCTVILCPEDTRASGYARGVSPGTREFALLSPFRKVEQINALFLTGGSAFGLDAAAGIMRYLSEKNIGYHTVLRPIPIVPAAVIYDLPVLDVKAFPGSDDAYSACNHASEFPTDQGNIGAGTGATIGKWAGVEYMMKGGLGYSIIQYDMIKVMAVSVVNAVGDVIDSNGKILAGAYSEDRFLAEQNPKSRWRTRNPGLGENTVLVALIFNCQLSKLELYYLSERAHNGIVRTIAPAHTRYDGDIVFSMSKGPVIVDLDLLTEIAVEATQQSIITAVKEAEQLGGIKAYKNI